MGRIWVKKGFPRGLMQHVNAGKVHLCTLPARVSGCIFFFLSAGWAGGFPAHDLGDYLPVQHCPCTAKPGGLWCSAQRIHGLPAWSNVFGGYVEIGPTTRARVKCLLTFYPNI